MDNINLKTGKKPYYKDNVEASNKRNAAQMRINGKYISKNHPWIIHRAGNWTSTDITDISPIQRDTKSKEGYVYAISDPRSVGWIKIGKADDIDTRHANFQTYTPHRNYKLIHSVQFYDHHVAEVKAHLLAEARTALPWSKHENGEWFQLTEEQALEILREVTLDG